MASSVDLGALRPSPADVRVVTSDGSTIAAHSSVLASASPVLERMIQRAPRIRILGASPDAVAAFLRFLYFPREATAEWVETAMAAHWPALLALAHAHRVPWLKQRAEEAVAARLTAECAVDALKLARLCDAPRLYLRCACLASKDLPAVKVSEGWRFAARHDAQLQLDLLQLLQDADQEVGLKPKEIPGWFPIHEGGNVQGRLLLPGDIVERKKRWERERASHAVYRELSDAMASLERAFTEASPCDDDGSGGACTGRQGILQLVRHLAGCGNKGGCPQCKSIFQLLRLHSSVCDRAEPCRVPLCSNLKMKMQAEKVDETWRLLVKKVARAGVMATLAANRKVPEVVKNSWVKYNSGSKNRAADIFR